MRRQNQQDELDQALKYAQLSQAGYNVQPSGRNRLFGGQQIVLTKNQQPLPTGFVMVNGKPEKDPSYLNPLEKSRMELNRVNQGIFGGAQVDANGDAQPVMSPQDRLKLLSPEDQAVVKGLADYTVDPSSLSARNNKKAAIVGLAKEIDPTYDQTQYPTRSKYRQEFSSGKVGANVRSFNTAIQHLSELNDATAGVPSNPNQYFEAAQRFGTQKFAGNSKEALAIQRENAALTAVDGELANIFKNSGGTDQEISAWRSAYNPNATRAAKQEYIKQGIKLMQGRVGALDSDYERVMGKKNTQALISPESQSSINKIMGGGQKQGGVVHVDANGNKAIVYPDGSYEEIQ